MDIGDPQPLHFMSYDGNLFYISIRWLQLIQNWLNL